MNPKLELRQMTITELAEDAFLKHERVTQLEMMNTPTDYDDRKKAFVALWEARVAAKDAEKKLRALA